MMEEQHSPSDSFEVFLIASFFPYAIVFVLLCLVFGSLYLDSSDCCEHVHDSTATTRPKESPQLSAGKKEISALKIDPVDDWDRFESLWRQEDVAACAQEDDARDVGSDEQETSEGGSEREIEEMEDEVSDSDDSDDEYDEDEDDNDNKEDYDDDGDDEDDSDDDDDDDDDDGGWEVLESRQLRREYEWAVRFVESQKNDEGMSKLSDVEKLRFYGLHKVAVEGPCQEPQPAPFNLSARTKWNAWRRLGIMSSDDAVEQYIDLLQEKFPNWRKDSLVDHGRSRARINSICSLLSFVELVMNKLWEISFRHTKMSGEGSQSLESEIRRP